MSDVLTAFVAYPSKDPSLSALISDATYQANGKMDRVRYESWEHNDISGNPLLAPIQEKIESSAFVVADITYLNPNVVYEIGYAIGKKRRVFLIRNSELSGDRDLAKEVGVFDTLGYKEYTGIDDLVRTLTSHIETDSLPYSLVLDHKAPVYIVEPPYKGQAATAMTSRLKKSRYRYRSFDPAEDPRLSAVDAIRQVASAAGVLVSLDTATRTGAAVHNLRSMFVAGLAHGMNKPCLILTPAGEEVPLDVRDQTKSFRHEGDIADHIGNFALDVTDQLQNAEPPSFDTTSLLQSLRIGDSTAENEMTTISQYYLTTDEYRRATKGDVNLVVGRKGSGKTALFISLRDRVRSDRRNIVVDLLPQGYQLLKLKEDILSYLSEGARQHLLTAFWEYLLLLEVAYKVLEKDRTNHKHNHEIYDLYIELQDAYEVNNFSAEGDFSERLLTLSMRLAEGYKQKYGAEHGRRLTTGEVTELLYTHDIRLLRSRLAAYLEKKEAVWVLFDNLDKGWSTQGIDVIDTIALRCLIDAGRKIEREMKRAGHLFHCIIFVRNDVYEHLMQNSPDYGKEMRAVLDWSEPDLLREMMRLRFVSALDGEANESTFEQIWHTLFISHYHGEETSSFIIDRSLMRPRNFIKIFNHCRGFANNFRRSKITEDDIEKGIRAYSQDLLIELDHELTDVFPGAKDLLYYFIDAASEMNAGEIKEIILTAGVDPGDVEKVFEFLVYYGVLGLRVDGAEMYIYDVNYNARMLEARSRRAGKDARFVINPGFWAALGTKHAGVDAGRV